MAVHPRAGQKPEVDSLANIPRLIVNYYTRTPDLSDPAQRVVFGTSGHRGSSDQSTFNDAHVAAIAQAIADHRWQSGHRGPLFLGMDTHALSEAAFHTALEVFAANNVPVRYQQGPGLTPTPVISHAILNWNRAHPDQLSDGVIITPSHNPPTDGGIKYNPPHGGPAEPVITEAIARRANELMDGSSDAIARLSASKAYACAHVVAYDFIGPYVEQLDDVIDMRAIEAADLSIGVDPLGGSSAPFWEPIAERWGLKIDVVSPTIDPTFRFMPCDRDGVIRMDCSSPWAMTGLIELREDYDIAFGNDPDADRHGIVTRGGLMNPNHYIAVAVEYLFHHRPNWSSDKRIGKTLVTSGMVDRVARRLGRAVYETPVGFKWFCGGLLDGSLGFGGEESAGASFLRRDGRPWTTDKDGIIMNLLAAEITAKTGKDPAEIYLELTEDLGAPVYERFQAPATYEQKQVLRSLDASTITRDTLAGEKILRTWTRAAGNNEPIGGLKVETENGWFAARPSGTEEIYKIYAESFQGPDHLRKIQEEAQALVDDVLRAAGVAERSEPREQAVGPVLSATGGES